jgi:hypothetical protein
VVGGHFVFSDPRGTNPWHRLQDGRCHRDGPDPGYTVKEADTGAAGLGAELQMQPDVIQGRNGHFHCIFVSYKSSEKEAWDDIVTRISLSLRPR